MSTTFEDLRQAMVESDREWTRRLEAIREEIARIEDATLLGDEAVERAAAALWEQVREPNRLEPWGHAPDRQREWYRRAARAALEAAAGRTP
jgi:hypothetical protein